MRTRSKVYYFGSTTRIPQQGRRDGINYFRVYPRWQSGEGEGRVMRLIKTRETTRDAEEAFGASV